MTIDRRPAILMLSAFPPHRCHAIGCARGMRDLTKLVCEVHEPMLPAEQAKLMKKNHTELQEKTRRVKPEWEAAAYRAVTAIARQEGKITADLAERREYHAVTKIEGRKVA